MTHPLHMAADIIEAYIETLDTSQSQCECCGMTKYDDFNAVRAKTELSAMVRKLRFRFNPKPEQPAPGDAP